MTSGLFVGLATLDLVNYVERLPRSGEKLQADGYWFGAGGPAANAAATFAALGGSATLLTRIGSGRLGELVAEDLSSAGVVVVDAATTGSVAISSVVVEGTGDRTVVSSNALGFEPGSSAAREIGLRAGDFDVVLVDGHHFDLVGSCVEVGGTHVVLDAGSRKAHDADMFEVASSVIASSAFAAPQHPREAVEWLWSQSRFDLVAVSAGGEPIVARDASGVTDVAVPTVEALDTLGAGDVLHGAFAYRLAVGDDPMTALGAAVTVASESCTTRGPRVSGDAAEDA